MSPGPGRPGITRVGWPPDGQPAPSPARSRGCAVINLAGESIGGGAMDRRAQAGAADSRILATRSLAPRSRPRRRRRLSSSSGSGVGYYGDRGSETRRREHRGPATIFSRTCASNGRRRRKKPQRPGVRVVPLRTGLVLEKSGGVAAADGAAVPVLRRRPDGVGTPVHAVDPSPRLDRDGAVDRRRRRTSPARSMRPRRIPVTNREFAHALGRALHRPALVPRAAFRAEDRAR